MNSKRKKKTKKTQHNSNEDFGSREFYCANCNVTFEVNWIDIFSLQEITHGYVGFEIQNEYIACPKCGRNANDEYVS